MCAGGSGILADLRKYAQTVKDFRLAHNAKEMSESLTAREETRRMREISQRQEADQHGVQEAHMMQAMEFNSAWSQNMTEFERQAREIEEACRSRQQKEYEAFQENLRQKETRSYKFSRELLLMRKSIETLANQGRCVRRRPSGGRLTAPLPTTSHLWRLTAPALPW